MQSPMMCLLRTKAFEVFIHPGRFAKPQASVLPLFDLACGGKALLKNVQSQVQRFAACQRQRRPQLLLNGGWLACASSITSSIICHQHKRRKQTREDDCEML